MSQYSDRILQTFDAAVAQVRDHQVLAGKQYDEEKIRSDLQSRLLMHVGYNDSHYALVNGDNNKSILLYGARGFKPSELVYAQRFGYTDADADAFTAVLTSLVEDFRIKPISEVMTAYVKQLDNPGAHTDLSPFRPPSTFEKVTPGGGDPLKNPENDPNQNQSSGMGAGSWLLLIAGAVGVSLIAWKLWPKKEKA